MLIDVTRRRRSEDSNETLMKATVSCAIFEIENVLPSVGFLQVNNLKPFRGIAGVPPTKVTRILGSMRTLKLPERKTFGCS